MSGELHVVKADRPRWFARLGFFLFIKKLSPETLDSLREEVLPLYERIDSIANSYRYAFATTDGKAEMVAERARQYDQAMRAWHQRWHLYDDWLKEESAMVIKLWTTYGPNEGFSLMGVFQRNLDALKVEDESVEALGISPPTLVADAWNPTSERWFDYQKRVLEKIRKALADYRDGIAGREGLAAWLKKRARGGRRGDQHLKWLVRFQVMEHEQQAIADDPTGDGTGRRVEVRTVQDAIRTTAELVGLTRRSVATHE